MRRDEPLPPPPREPDLDECCGSGCDPCVFDLYEQRLARWQARCEALQASTTGDRAPGADPGPSGGSDKPA